MKLLIALILLPINFFLNAYTIKSLWFWFFVPLGVPAIGIFWAFGITLLIGFLTTKDMDTDYAIEKKGNLGWTKIVVNTVTPLLVLLFGYITHLFM